jgi:sRNA-binding protein
LTASGWLTLAVLAALVAVLTCISLGLWRMLDREQTEHARSRFARFTAEGEAGRQRRSAIEREAALAELRADIAFVEQQLAKYRAAHPTRPASARCDLRIVR